MTEEEIVSSLQEQMGCLDYALETLGVWGLNVFENPTLFGSMLVRKHLTPERDIPPLGMGGGCERGANIERSRIFRWGNSSTSRVSPLDTRGGLWRREGASAV